MTPYAELQVTTNYSFLRGGAHADELVATAKALGLKAIGIADRNTLAGAVRAHVAAKREGLRLVVGARLDLNDGPSLLCYPTDRAAYGRLCQLLTLGQRRVDKGECELYLEDVYAHAEAQIFIALPPEHDLERFEAQLKDIRGNLETFYLAATYLYRGPDRKRLGQLAAIAKRCNTPLVATNDVHYHVPERRPLQDVITCIREGCTIAEAGFHLHANAERHLKPAEEMLRLFKGYDDAVARSGEIVDQCNFSLEELRYEYPDEPVPQGKSPQEHLIDLTWEGAAWRYPDGVSDKIKATLRHELDLIEELNYAPYFLTVYDIVKFARSQEILCQGRGSAANSAVCYCLGITAVDPTEIDLLFERFVSAERNEPPDIDVDFEHERREEVIQYIYERYGRARAGLAATVITYRGRSAVREVGKVMGLSEDVVGTLAGTVWGRMSDGLRDEQIRQAGLDPDDALLHRTLELTDELIGFPRHLSQHVGGFVLTRGPLCEVVPIGNAAMEDRTVVEWDKDDLDALGILKVDVLGLGMLTCIRKCFELLKDHYDKDMSLASVPREDPAVYDMLCVADSVGVFQVESRAQMNMLPRLKPRKFYDLVIEVAIVRPGPIQGDMVHPYLRRRSGAEPVEFPSPDPAHGPPDELKRVLNKTLGVPLFQEQAMRIAIDAAKFTPAEANQLRHAMATFRRRGTIDTLKDKLINRMVERGYTPDFAARCFKQIEGFGDYGFPESHSASFAHLVYVSSWLKCHYPVVFACGLLNSQPMGFYAPAQIVRDAREHECEVLPVDINHSFWDGALEPAKKEGWALRLGTRHVDGFGEAHGLSLQEARLTPYTDVYDLWQRGGLPVAQIEKLAAADAFRSIGLDRRQALWEVRALKARDPLPLFAHVEVRDSGAEPKVTLPVMPLGEHVINDYQTLRLSLKAHPISFLRNEFTRGRIISNNALKTTPNGRWVTVAGVVLIRQRPGTAKGVVFMTLEDETGVANAVIWPKMLEKYRRIVMSSRLIMIRGTIQSHEGVIHVVAKHIEDYTHLLGRLTDDTATFKPPLGRADEVKRPGPDPNSYPRGHPRNVRIIPKSRDFH